MTMPENNTEASNTDFPGCSRDVFTYHHVPIPAESTAPYCVRTDGPEIAQHQWRKLSALPCTEVGSCIVRSLLDDE